MSTLFAIYVRAPGSDMLAARLARHGSLINDPPSEFTCVELSRYDGPSDADLAELASLSADLDADVIWLGYTSVSESFRYHHWRSGQMVRALAYRWIPPEEGWDLAEGEPEPWEGAAFFHPSDIDTWPRPADDAERETMRHVLLTGEIRAGLIFPSVDARVTSRMVAEYFGFPGWV